MPKDRATLFWWEMPDFRDPSSGVFNKKGNMSSNASSLLTDPSIQFALFYKPSFNWGSIDFIYGVSLEQNDNNQPLKFDVKIWLQNAEGQKSDEHSVSNYAFKTAGDEYGSQKCTEHDRKLIRAFIDQHETLFICCELINLNWDVKPLNLKPISTENYDYEFHQDQWELYGGEIYDAIIKIGDNEFKVLKFPFIAHSSVFKSMFLSKFNDGTISKIQVNDVNEKTMEHLIKWMYTNQFENNSPIEDLFDASIWYDIKILKKICTETMLDTLNSTNTFQRLIISVKHNSESLKKELLKYISNLPTGNLTNFLSSPKFKKLNNTNPQIAQEVKELLDNEMKRWSRMITCWF